MAGMTLSELSKIETDTLRKSVIDALLYESDAIGFVPWETTSQISSTHVRIQDLPSVAFRRINAGYTASDGHLEQVVESVYPLGVLLDCDKMIARAANTIADARAVQQTLGLKAMAYKFNDHLVNGDPTSDPSGFTGLKTRINNLYADGYTSQYIYNNGTSGDGILLSSAESHNFLNHLDQLIYAISGHNPDVLLMNAKMLLALRAILRKEGLLQTTTDMFDRQVDMYHGARLVDIGVQADQSTEIITSTETLEAAGAAESTSIYAVKFGVGTDFWGIQQYPMEVTDKGLLEDSPIYRTEVDWPLGLALVNPRSIARLYGIIPDSST